MELQIHFNNSLISVLSITILIPPMKMTLQELKIYRRQKYTAHTIFSLI